MADSKITALTSIGASTDPANDPLVLVDVSDTSMAATGTTKKVTLNNLLSSSPTATGNFTITGDLTVDTSTLKVDSTNDRVGIGIATPSWPLDIRSATAVAQILSTTGTNAAYLQVSNTGGIFYLGRENSAGTSFASPAYSAVLYAAGAYPLVTTVNGSERYRIASDGVATWSNVGGVGSTAMTLNSTGLGVGVTPSAWATYKGLQVGYASLAGYAGSDTLLGSNVYFDGGAFRYISTATASSYRQLSGVHSWSTAPSGTAGNAITFTQAMTLDASGNLLVGTTTQPSGVTGSKGTFKSAASDWTSVVWNSNATPFGLRIQHDTDVNGSSSQFLFCYAGSTTRAEIRSNGGLANYQANNVNLSDARTKTDIKPLASYWNKIKALELVTFKYKDQTHDDDNIGLIAQQVESVAPELIDADGFGETPADSVPLKTIYTTDLYHASIKALQEAMARIEVLEAKLA